MYSISICIPTYNRSDKIFKLAKKILTCTRTDIELVILDNASNDNTVSQLSLLNDNRLNLISSENNNGVLYNVVNVLNFAKGVYCVLLLDKDDINIDKIDDFIDFLLKNNLSCGISEYFSDQFHRPILIQSGIISLLKIGYSCHHPTGYFFNTQLLSKLNIIDRFLNYEFVGHFPFEFMQAELALMGDTAIYYSNLFETENLKIGEVKKSVGTNANLEEAFFSPYGRLKMAINFSLHITTLNISINQQYQLIQACYYKGLINATVGYKNIIGDKVLCHHYHMKSRKISILELILIGVKYSIGFLSVCRKKRELRFINLFSLILSRGATHKLT
jgi:glycosyltransferase involved in cell wall biosynthesis